MMLTIALLLAHPVAWGEAPDTAAVLRSDRIEFDERMIRGQTASAGAVYLFQRTPRALPSLVAPRADYRAQIVAPVLGPDRPLDPIVSRTSGEAVAR